MSADLKGALRQLVAGEPGRREPVVFSSSCWLRRNLAERFPDQLGRAEGELLRERLFAVLGESASCQGAIPVAAAALSAAEADCLAECELLPRRRGAGGDHRGLLLLADPRLSIRVGDGDHLCLQSRRDGWSPEELWADLDSLDAELDGRLEFAFSEEFGYLTASPRQAGTGLECRALLHLPALALRGELPRLLRGLTALHAEARLRGESEGPGTLLELRNARSLGRSEAELLDGFGGLVLKLGEFEAKARERLLSEARSLLEDRVWTAYGRLRYGRLLSAEAAGELLGALHLGSLTGILQTVDYKDVQGVWMAVGDGALQVEAGEDLEREAREERRAERLRSWLVALESAHLKG
jgi:protein arginine kinase